MNPEEGELRPQLLDRFGLAADIVGSADPAERAVAVERRLEFDRNPVAFCERWMGADVALRGRLAKATPGAVPAALLNDIGRLCASVGAEGLRADLTIARAAAALAGWDGREEATIDDVRRVAPMALAHRRRRSPFDDHGIDDDEIDRALDETGEARPDEERTAEPDSPVRVVRLETPRGTGEGGGRRSVVEGQRGRVVGDRTPPPGGAIGSVAVGATVRAAAARHIDDPESPTVIAADVREAIKEQRAGNLIVFAVDASGSMGAERRMEAAKGAVLSLLLDAYQRRDLVAMVTFRGEGADVVLRPTSSVEVAKARLAQLATGGTTRR